jgi:CheY-like chemotaxis protein
VASGSERRPKILIIGDESGAPSFLSTFLSSMRCLCTVVSTSDALATATAREPFDVAVVDLTYSAHAAERLDWVVKQIPPSLVQHTMVISKDRPEEKAANLMDGFGIPRIPQNRLLPGLWETIQKLLIVPRTGHLARSGQRMAWMMFDSSDQSTRAGLRGRAGAGRHLAYQYDNVIVDISIESSDQPGRISLVGQAVDSQTGRGISESLPVVLNGRAGPLAMALTNPNGEFALEFEFAREVELEVRTDKGAWAMIPLPRLNSAAGPSAWQAVG